MSIAIKSTRQAFGESLAELGAKNSKIVVLDADLAKSTKSEIFMKKFPERFYEMGISEANMIGVASGLAFTGKLPFLCSFGAFLTGRYDTIRMSSVYSGANVRLIGTHAGVGIGDDGHSQMGLEDIALMRVLPTMSVYQPMDADETTLIMNYLVEKHVGPAYLRLTRQNLPSLLTDALKDSSQKWEMGKILKVKSAQGSSKKVVLFATGASTAEAAKAHALISAKGIACEVYNVHSLKPFDSKGVLTAIQGASKIYTIEDHSVIGGLGTCVSEVLSENGIGIPLIKLGIQDTFGESGECDELYDLHGISAKKISERASRDCL